MGLTVLGNNAIYFAIMMGPETKTTAERAQRHRNGLARKLDLILAEVAVIRRRVDQISTCPIAEMAAERRSADRAIAAALHGKG